MPSGKKEKRKELFTKEIREHNTATKNKSTSKFFPARDHMQFPSYKKRRLPQRMVIKIARTPGISQGLVGASRQ